MPPATLTVRELGITPVAATPVINLTLTGPGNTIRLHLGKAHIG